MRYAAGLQGIQIGQPQLHSVVTKNISHYALELRIFPI
jgi:hypothetical protein